MSAGQRPKLTVVIVNYNTRDLVLACLRSLSLSSEDPQIIVVDNASDDGSAEAVRSEFPHVELLAMPENRWYCGGNNLGLVRAEGKYVMLLNPDTEIEADSLTYMVDFMEWNPEYDGCTGQLHFPDGTIQQTCSGIPNYPYLLLQYSVLRYLFPNLQKNFWQKHSYAGWERETDRDIEVMPGSCYLVRRGIFQYDERYLLYFGEDTFSTVHARAGSTLRFHFLSKARILHHESSSTRNRSSQRIFFRDLAMYLRHHFGVPAWALWWFCALPLRLWLEWRPRY